MKAASLARRAATGLALLMLLVTPAASAAVVAPDCDRLLRPGTPPLVANQDFSGNKWVAFRVTVGSDGAQFAFLAGFSTSMTRISGLQVWQTRSGVPRSSFGLFSSFDGPEQVHVQLLDPSIQHSVRSDAAGNSATCLGTSGRWAEGSYLVVIAAGSSSEESAGRVSFYGDSGLQVEGVTTGGPTLLVDRRSFQGLANIEAYEGQSPDVAPGAAAVLSAGVTTTVTSSMFASLVHFPASPLEGGPPALLQVEGPMPTKLCFDSCVLHGEAPGNFRFSIALEADGSISGSGSSYLIAADVAKP